MTNTLYIIITVLLLIIGIMWREIRNLKKERDYYIEVDEENQKLREKLPQNQPQ